MQSTDDFQLGAPLAYMYCEDDNIAELLLALHWLGAMDRDRKGRGFMEELAAGR